MYILVPCVCVNDDVGDHGDFAHIEHMLLDEFTDTMQPHIRMYIYGMYELIYREGFLTL